MNKLRIGERGVTVYDPLIAKTSEGSVSATSKPILNANTKISDVVEICKFCALVDQAFSRFYLTLDSNFCIALKSEKSQHFFNMVSICLVHIAQP